MSTSVPSRSTSRADEQDHDRAPQSLGFDLRSRGPSEIRYIEVKGRRGNGAVSLTANEWIKDSRFGNEFWLYVVHGCGSDNPRLTIVRDPARCLTVNEEVFTSARFRVNASEIPKHGVAASALPTAEA